MADVPRVDMRDFIEANLEVTENNTVGVDPEADGNARHFVTQSGIVLLYSESLGVHIRRLHGKVPWAPADESGRWLHPVRSSLRHRSGPNQGLRRPTSTTPRVSMNTIPATANCSSSARP
jgi:hypothetical protein